jgi:Tfp pilus assembly protein PilX
MQCTNRIVNSCSSRHNERGFTLIEAVTGLVVFLLVAIPSMQYAARLSMNTRATDMQAAFSLLKGETDILYKTKVFPEPGRNVTISKKAYTVSCARDADTGLVVWSMHVTRGEKHIAGVKGLIYVPAK